MKYGTSYNMPRVMPLAIEFPFCAVGEFAVLFQILEKRADETSINLLEKVVDAFQNEFEEEIENLSFHLSR